MKMLPNIELNPFEKVRHPRDWETMIKGSLHPLLFSIHHDYINHGYYEKDIID